MMEESQQPEDDAREEGAPGEPGEATPSDAAPEEQPAPEETPAGSGEEHPGPEIGGMEELAQAAGEAEAAVEEAPPEEQPAAPTPLDLAADARYRATGKRKSAVARVTLKPGEGTYTINGRHLDEYFPRVRLQRMARQPLEAAGYQNRMDVVARIHGGGVSAQATALRHGVARALVEADPSLRGELKRRGYLTRDPRVKERKKAGLKKARKRPQFSKR
jgi:small subunit ribosomal protein S9